MKKSKRRFWSRKPKTTEAPEVLEVLIVPEAAPVQCIDSIEYTRSWCSHRWTKMLLDQEELHVCMRGPGHSGRHQCPCRSWTA